MATRSTNLLKTNDGTLIYKRRHSLPVSESDDMSGSSGTHSATAVRSSHRMIRSSYGSHANSEDVNDKTPDRKRPAEVPAVGSVPKRQRTIRTTESGQCVEWDAYCWLCHSEGSASDCCCELCPRLYHQKCLGMNTVVSCWVCPECEKIMKAENINTRTKPLIDVNMLCLLLRNVICRMKYSQSEPFFRPVDCAALPQYTDYVYHPMDFSTLERNVKKRAYGSTEAFVADVKWIVHNCVIYNGKKHRLTTVAKTVLKICRHETNEIEICSDCYKNSCTKPSVDWFCEPCHIPHKLVWAKMKGYPYWPAKVLQEQNGQVDVRFFGEHDRAWVPVAQVYMISEQYPVTNKLRKGFDVATAELHRHVEMLRERIGSFTYAPPRTPYVLLEEVSPGGSARSPSSKLSQHRKKLLRVKPVSYENEGRPAVKLVVRWSSSSNKQPSVVSKTADALKLRYTSIIATRRSAAANSRSDSSLAKAEDAIRMVTGGSKVADCVVNVERYGTSNSADGNAALDCTDKVSGTRTPDEPTTDTSVRQQQSEDSEAADLGPTACPADDSVIPTNAASNPDTAETGCYVENETVNDDATEDAPQSLDHDIADNDVEEQSGAECQNAASDEVTVDGNDNITADVVVNDNEHNVVTDDNSNSSTPCDDLTHSTDCATAVASDEMNTDSAKTVDEVLMDTGECSSLLPTADIAKSTGVSEGQLLSEQFPVTSTCGICTLSYIPASVSEINAMVESTGKISAPPSVCPPSEHNTDVGARHITSTKDHGKFADTVSEDVLDCLYSSCMVSVSDGECVSESNRDLDANSVKLVCADEVDDGSAAEKESCNTDDMVTGVLSMGTDLENDEEHMAGDSISTVQHVSQAVAVSTATATPSHSPDISTSVPCSSPRFPFLEFLVTLSKQSADSVSASNLSTSVNTSSTVDAISSTLGTSCDSPACSSVLGPSLALSVSSLPLCYSVAQSEQSLSYQPSSVASYQVLPSSRDSSVSESSSIDVNGCDARAICCISSPTTASAVNSSTPTAVATAGLHSIVSSSANSCGMNLPHDHSMITAHCPTIIANVNQHMAAEDSNSNDAASVQSSVSQDILSTTTNAADSISSSGHEPITTGSPFCFSVTGYDFQKYRDMLQSATDNMLEQFCSDILNGAEGSAIRKHMQLEVNRLKWEHAQEIAEIRHNAATALAEQKLTLELVHTNAIEELQNKLEESKAAYTELHRKLTREKEFAVAQTKKKQWCANCGKEAIFYCCWNTSYCDYPCQLQHWPRHQLTCAQTTDATRNTEAHDNAPQQQSLRTGQQQAKNSGQAMAGQHFDGQNQQRQMSRIQMVRSQLPTPPWSQGDAPVNMALGARAQAGARFVPVAPHQRTVPTIHTVSVAGNSGQGIVLVRPPGSSSTMQLPMLPPSDTFFLPPRVLMS